MDVQASESQENLDKKFVDWEHMELKVGIQEGKDYFLVP